ncbi:GrpB family protein [Armatimonas sp.]|uniref:GrpB family protein n=1 Tax=Armatimonas sp. TaxID=1872638 RepID=UPI003753E1F6
MQSVILLEYQATWPSQFNEVAAELVPIFESDPVCIEHIGSTSVPELCAKPVLDILLGAQDLAVVMARADGLANLGYRYRPEYETEIPERRYFVRPEGSQLRIHLHAVVQGGAIWLRHLAFREALRKNPELSQEYATLKRQLAARYSEDKAAYTKAKSPFIARVLASFKGTCGVEIANEGGGGV